MPNKQRPFDYGPIFRLMAVLLGAISMAMGWEARSQGYLWTSGYNARLGREAIGTTLGWIIIGALLILAGIFPWGWFVNRDKR